MDVLKEAAQKIKNARYAIVLSGAGISVDSGIPDFRSPGGLWDTIDPMEYVSIYAFMQNPEKSWELLFYFAETIGRANPNDAHYALAKMEERGLLKGIITQNIDNLHQRAGSKKVIEFHGNISTMICLTCYRVYQSADFAEAMRGKQIPLCSDCHYPLKPNAVFFGEQIPSEAIRESFEMAQQTDLLLTVGTSAAVAPANQIPYIAKSHGAYIIEFDIADTLISDLADLRIRGSARVTLPQVLHLLT